MLSICRSSKLRLSFKFFEQNSYVCLICSLEYMLHALPLQYHLLRCIISQSIQIRIERHSTFSLHFFPDSPTVGLKTKSSLDFQNARQFRLRAGGVGVRIPAQAKDFSPKLQTSSGAHPAHIQGLLSSSPGGKAAGGVKLTHYIQCRG